jgi:hypothetical protein
LSCRRRIARNLIVSSPGLRPWMPALLCTQQQLPGCHKANKVFYRNLDPSAYKSSWKGRTCKDDIAICVPPPSHTHPHQELGNLSRRQVSNSDALYHQHQRRKPQGMGERVAQPQPAARSSKGRRSQLANHLQSMLKVLWKINTLRVTKHVRIKTKGHLRGPCSKAAQKLANSRLRAPDGLSGKGKYWLVLRPPGGAPAVLFSCAGGSCRSSSRAMNGCCCWTCSSQGYCEDINEDAWITM